MKLRNIQVGGSKVVVARISPIADCLSIVIQVTDEEEAVDMLESHGLNKAHAEKVVKEWWAMDAKKRFHMDEKAILKWVEELK